MTLNKLKKVIVASGVGIAAAIIGMSTSWACTIMNGQTYYANGSATSGSPGQSISVYANGTRTGLSGPWYVWEDTGNYCMFGAMPLTGDITSEQNSTTGNFPTKTVNTDNSRSDMQALGDKQICFSTGGDAAWPVTFTVV